MGGTRMGRNEKEGVVDENLKVFGQQNLYMNGASVFPSFGFTNPTFPGVQLSIRLADHLLKKTI
jgi:choline dehydrogenase-like flavoprotein